MNLSAESEIRVRAAVLLGIQLLTVLGAIGLLSRMGPAVEQILRNYAVALRASHEMTAALSTAGCDTSTTGDHDRFTTALETLRGVSAGGESAESIRTIDHTWQRALTPSTPRDGADCAAVLRTGGAIDDLVDTHLQAMKKAGEGATRLAAAGTWTAVILGAVAFAVSAGMVRRLRRRFILPLDEVVHVLTAADSGDAHRRCRRLDAPHEFDIICHRLNRLLDARSSATPPGQSIEAADRPFLHHLIDQREGGVLLVDRQGNLVAANTRGHQLLAGPRGVDIREAIHDLARHPNHRPNSDDLLAEVESVGDDAGWIVTLRSGLPWLAVGEPPTESEA